MSTIRCLQTLVATLGTLVLWTVIPAHADEEAKTVSKLTLAERDSLSALGEAQIGDGDPAVAVKIFHSLTASFANDAGLWILLGDAYLRKEDYKSAENAYKMAKKIDPNLPEAYVGIGLTYAERPARGLGALHNFRKALGEAKRATKIDSTYAPAFRLLGELYERFREDHDRAIKYYLQYIEKESDNPVGLFYFGLACIQAKRYELVDQHLAPYLEVHAGELRLIPLVAQALFNLKKYELALEHFERYLNTLDVSEKALYTDISLVASESEQHEFASLEDNSAKKDFLIRFWKRRDPDILTSINERIIEHYRRVWFARNFFSTKVYPWDRRGEVYIRFGEPDFRSRSDNRNFIVSAEVEAVRMRMAVDLYGPQATYLTFVGPVFPIRTRRDPFSITDTPPEENLGDLATFGTLAEGEAEDSSLEPDNIDLTPGVDPLVDQDPREEFTDRSGNPFSRLTFDSFAPVTIDGPQESVPWETWTYTRLKNGVEFTFTDEVGRGDYDFAPLPHGVVGNETLRKTVQLVRYTPGVIFQKTVAESPDFYRPNIGGDALDFYFDLADFRGEDGQTRIEVYYGVPPRDVEVAQTKDDVYLIQVQGTMALADELHTNIYRESEFFSYQNSRGFDQRKGAFVPDLLGLEAPPGKYQLQVQLEDMISGRVGIYKQDLEIRDYNSSQVKVSGIELAFAVEQDGKNNRFRKGDIWVIPVPSRTYPTDSQVFAYFEIYNLKRDEFGQTRYKIRYQVKFSSGTSTGIAGAISRGFRALVSRKKPQVSIEYDQIGSTTTEKEYVELDLRKAKPGVNVLEVTVTDQVSSQKDTREVVFMYGAEAVE